MLEIPGTEAWGMQEVRAAGELCSTRFVPYLWPRSRCRSCQAEPENPKLPQKRAECTGQGLVGGFGLGLSVNWCPYECLSSHSRASLFPAGVQAFIPAWFHSPASCRALPAVGTAGIPWMSQNDAQPCWHLGIS